MVLLRAGMLEAAAGVTRRAEREFNLPPLHPRNPRNPQRREAFKPKLNIFALDESPILAARYANDMHVSKMTTETAQILCTIHHQCQAPRIYIDEINLRIKEKLVSEGKPLEDYMFQQMSVFSTIEMYNIKAKELNLPPLFSELYKPTHKNHPSVVWAGDSIGNYSWLYRYFLQLGLEYKHRFNKDHASILKLQSLLSQPPSDMRIGSGLQPARVVASPRLMTIYYGHQYIFEGNTYDPHGTEPYNEGMAQTWDNAVSMYQQYYCVEKFELGRWTNREIPSWFKEHHERLGAKEVSVERKIRGKIVLTKSMSYT